MSRNGRGPKYTALQVERLLSLVETYLPVGSNQWEALAAKYNTDRPEEIPERDVDSLRNKFKALRNHRKPTGLLFVYTLYVSQFFLLR